MQTKSQSNEQWLSPASSIVDAGDGKPDPIAVKERGGSGPFTVLVNGIPLPDTPPPACCCSNPEGPGCVLLAAMLPRAQRYGAVAVITAARGPIAGALSRGE